jgi:protein-tyrosine phosphatase
MIPSNIKHLFIKADDSISFNMSPHFQQACEFIEEARQSNGRILVHCACGVSRSSTLCCAYLIKHHSMSVEDAIIHLRARRHIIQPNSAFLEQLIRYNEQIECDKKTMNIITEQLENV